VGLAFVHGSLLSSPVLSSEGTAEKCYKKGDDKLILYTISWSNSAKGQDAPTNACAALSSMLGKTAFGVAAEIEKHKVECSKRYYTTTEFWTKIFGTLGSDFESPVYRVSPLSPILC